MRLAAAIALALAAAAFAVAAEPAATPSRPPEKECAWARLDAAGLGVGFFYQKCVYGARKTDFAASVKDGIVYETWTDSGPRKPKDKSPRSGSDPRIQVFAKSVNENISTAIKRVAAKGQRRRERKHCDVVTKSLDFLDETKRAYVMVPDEELAAKLANKAEGDIPPPACGPLGDQPDSLGYFEYHPDESTTRFVYVDFGQEEHPSFDEKSLIFLP